MVDADHPRLSIARQCELLSIARSSFYRSPCGESEMNLTLMRLIDEQFLDAADGAPSSPARLERGPQADTQAYEQDGACSHLPETQDQHAKP